MFMQVINANTSNRYRYQLVINPTLDRTGGSKSNLLAIITLPYNKNKTRKPPNFLKGRF